MSDAATAQAPPEILIVEDSATQAEAMRFVLEGHGHRTAVASNGREALARLADRRPDLVVSDVVMPELDGYELCRRIKADPVLAAVPVLLLTVLSDPRAVLKGLACGADGFLVKPCSGDLLLSRVAHLLANRPQGRGGGGEPGLEMDYGGERFVVTAGRRQVVDLLLSTYEAAARQNLELAQTRDQLQTLNATLEQRVVARTAELAAADASLSRLNRALRILSGCNSALVHARDEAALLQEICRLIVDLGAYPMAWVGFVQHDERKSVQPVAWAGRNDGYLEALECSWGEGDHACGPVGRAIRERRAIVVEDIGADPRFAPWREEAQRRGYAASLTLPVAVEAKALGVLVIYAGQAGAFDPEEARLLQELADDLGYGILSLREAETRRRYEEQLERQANYDDLTGLPNRNLFRDRLGRDLIRAGRPGHAVAVLVLDIDRLQAVNDTVGHEAGDAMLRHVAAALVSCLRQGDTLARLSGDEFALALDDLPRAEDAAAVIRRLQAAASRPLEVAGRSMSVGTSIGVSLFPRDGDDVATLMMHADAAMRSAKSLGGNTFHFYAPDMNEQLSARFALEADLRRAIDGDELQIHYQPRVSLANGAMSGGEALVRWLHPRRGLLAPAEFVPLAEETGLIEALGEWVLRRVCEQLRRWSEAGLAMPPVAVNLSPRQFRGGNLVAIVERALKDHGVAAAALELEITESTAIADVAAAAATMNRLKALGTKLSLDAFGAGHSALIHLRRFPISSLKIDRAFVRELTTDPDDAAICIALIDLAHSLRLEAVAKGVETEGQMNYLRRHRCDHIQGFLYARPLPPDEFARFAGENRRLALPVAEGPQATLLLVDDEPNVLSSLRRLLRADGYRILTAGSAREGLELLAENEVQVILSDQRMPEMNGTEFLERVREMYPDTVRIVLSGYTDLQTITDAINRGSIYKFLTKPWDPEHLREHVREAFRHQVAERSAAS